jgi:hypothetical protein
LVISTRWAPAAIEGRAAIFGQRFPAFDAPIQTKTRAFGSDSSI